MDTYTRSRLEVLNWLVSFAIPCRYSDGLYSLPGDYHFIAEPPVVGDLVRLGFCESKTWYLGWYLGRVPQGNRFSDEHHIASIEDMSVCRWSNVEVRPFNRKVLEMFPHWRWSDAQWRLADWWRKPVRKCERVRWWYPQRPVFDGSKVRLELRDNTESVLVDETLPDWRKVKKKDLAEIYWKAAR